MAEETSRTLRLNVDSKPAERGSKRVVRSLESVQRHSKGAASDVDRLKNEFRRLDRVGRLLKASLAGVFTVLGSGAVLYATKRVLDLGAAVEETGSKFRTVFGSAVGEVNAFLDRFATKAGLSRREAQELVATTGAIAQGMGFARDESAAFSIEATKIAADLASFNNVAGGTETVLSNIQSALAGEFEGLKKFGIVIRASDVEQRALARSTAEAAEALTQQERALATLELITERAGVAVGDLDRTQHSAANTARQLGAMWRNLRDAGARAVLPILAEVMRDIASNREETEELSASLRASGDRFLAWSKVAWQAVRFVGSTLGGLVRIAFNVGEMIGRTLEVAFTSIASGFMDLVNRLTIAPLNFLLKQMNRIPGVDIDFQIAGLPAEAFWRNASQQATELKGDVLDVVDVFGDWATAWHRVAEAADAAWKAGTRATGAAQSQAATLAERLRSGAELAGPTGMIPAPAVPAPERVPTPPGARAEEASPDGAGGRDVSGGVGSVLAAGAHGGEIAGVVQAVAAFGPLGVLLPAVNSALEALEPTLDKLLKPLVELGTVIGEALKPGVEAVAMTFELTLLPIIEALREPLRAFGEVVAALHPILTTLNPLFANLTITASVLAPIMEAFTVVMTYVMEGLGLVLKAAGAIVEKFAGWATDAGERLEGFGQGLIDDARWTRDRLGVPDTGGGMFGFFDWLDELVDEQLPDFSGAVGRATDALSNVPRALPLELLRHQAAQGELPDYGAGTTDSSPSGGGRPSTDPPVAGDRAPGGPENVYVLREGAVQINGTDMSPDELLRAIERALKSRASRGGTSAVQYAY